MHATEMMTFTLFTVETAAASSISALFSVMFASVFRRQKFSRRKYKCRTARKLLVEFTVPVTERCVMAFIQ